MGNSCCWSSDRENFSKSSLVLNVDITQKQNHATLKKSLMFVLTRLRFLLFHILFFISLKKKKKDYGQIYSAQCSVFLSMMRAHSLFRNHWRTTAKPPLRSTKWGGLQTPSIKKFFLVLHSFTQHYPFLPLPPLLISECWQKKHLIGCGNSFKYNS